MRSTRDGSTEVAESRIALNFSEMLVAMILAEGDALGDLLTQVGIVAGQAHTADWVLDSQLLRESFTEHAVVMRGAFVDACWGRTFARDPGTPADTLLCTCHAFGLHAQCEHWIFVRSLTGDPACSLEEVPSRRKRGRPQGGSRQPRAPRSVRRRAAVAVAET